MCSRWSRSRGGWLYTNVLGRRMGDRPLDTPWKIKPQMLVVRSPVRATTRMRGASMQAESVTVECKECGKTFRRTSDRKGYEYLAERTKPVKEQRGALQCSKCQKWFCRRGGLAAHKCRESREQLTETPARDEDSALLAPSSLRRVTWPDLAVDRQDMCGVCVCI